MPMSTPFGGVVGARGGERSMVRIGGVDAPLPAHPAEDHRDAAGAVARVAKALHDLRKQGASAFLCAPSFAT